jgi:4-aminobutyrate aminotransferase
MLGAVLFYVGMNSNVLELTPSLNMTMPEVDEAISIIEVALTDVLNGRVPDEVLEGFEGW